jgi:hypothetical protein
MKKILAVVGLFFSLQSQAALLSVELDNTSYQQGDVISASIWMSDLNTALTGFDLSLWFNPISLAYQSISFGSYLTVVDGDSFNDAGAVGNLLSFYEFSFNAANDLALLQNTPDKRFQLATISFIAQKAGAFVMNFDKVELTDGFDNMIEANDFQISNASGTIEGTQDVPAPTPLLLLAPALLWLARRR